MNKSDAMKKNLDARGITYEEKQRPILNAAGNPVMDKNGDIMTESYFQITAIPEIEKEVNNFFVHSIPCWFDGCEKLREEYDAEVEKATEDGKCKPCEKGAISRKFIPRIRAAVKYNHANKPTTQKNEIPDTRVREIPRTIEASNGGAKVRKTMLRKAADHIAKVLGYSPTEEN